MRKSSKWLAAIGIAVVILPILGFIAFLPFMLKVAPDWCLAPVRGTLLYITGQSSRPLPEAIRAVSYRIGLQRAYAQIQLTAKRIATDGGMELWESGGSLGRLWMTSNSLQGISYMLAEQNVGIYDSHGAAVRPGDIVIDCGANYGIYTRRALNMGAAKVVAIEPSPRNIECLQRNFSTEIAKGRVIVYPKGAWDKDDVLALSLNPDSPTDSLIFKRENAKGAVMVPLTTIDKMVAELKLARVDVIKMDIEGAERQALAGARSTIAQFKPRMAICVYHRPDDRDVLPPIVLAANPGYSVHLRWTQEDLHIAPEVAFFKP